MTARMQQSWGCACRPVWLIGDSNPPDERHVRYPLDPWHPTRHNIWTPVLDVIQETVYPRRFAADTFSTGESAVYVRNAVEAPADRLDSGKVMAKILELRELAAVHQPVLVLTFGSFAFHAGVAALEQSATAITASQLRLWRKTRIEGLRRQFDARVTDASCQVVPLLHQSVARSFAHAHRHFNDGDDNYFVYTGRRIARRLLTVPDPRMWR